MDYGAILYGPVYATLGVDASLHLPTGDFPVRAIDKTGGLELKQGHLVIETIMVAATVRASELAAQTIDLGELDGSQLTLNGKTWNVASHRELPCPTGPGEVALILEDVS